MQWFVLLLAIGFCLLAAEIFLPGGVLGALGGLALLGAVIAAFAVFGPGPGVLIALGVVVCVGIGMVLWIMFFPKTSLGRKLTLAQTESDYKAAKEEARQLVGQDGVAVTDLRPAGLVRINGRNYDVVSEGALIPRGAAVRVVRAEGNRIVVRAVG